MQEEIKKKEHKMV